MGWIIIWKKAGMYLEGVFIYLLKMSEGVNVEKPGNTLRYNLLNWGIICREVVTFQNLGVEVLSEDEMNLFFLESDTVNTYITWWGYGLKRGEGFSGVETFHLAGLKYNLD